MCYEHVFNEMEIIADPFALCELQGRCDLGLDRQSFATLHYVLSGRGEIILGNDQTIEIGVGSLVLIPAYQHHTLRSFGESGSPIPECHPAELDLERFLHGDEFDESSGRLLAICARVKVGFRSVTGLIDLVRNPIIATNVDDSGLGSTIQKLLQELSSPRLGSKAMIRTLLLECMIELLRSNIEKQDSPLKWMSVLKDERLWGALRVMLELPGDRHSLESLADQAGMGRSTFAQRFTDAYGSGPMELLRDLRMRMAASMLEKSDTPIKRVAELVGFKSRSAFSRAFEIHFGHSPREFRKKADVNS